MKRVFLFVMCLVMALSAEAQTAADLNEGLQVTTGAQAGDFTVSWWGKAGRTYFVQQSFDLMTWQYVPVVMSGAEDVSGLNFSCTDTRQFWRLRYTDESYTGTAEDADFDFDGLTNLEEVATFHSDPFEWDTDQDGLDDYSEVHTYLTDPASADTDGDGMSDGLEIWNGLDPTSATGDDGASGDPDNDGLTNLDELTLSFTDPHDADCDDDTLTDGEEFLIYGTSPWSPDSDGDTLGDADEINLYATDPNDSDSDDDDMRDGWEVGNSLDPNSAAGDDGGGGDPDGDLLTNLSEHNFYTDPHDADSDDDTLTDYAEVMLYSTNPNDADTDDDGLGDAAEVLTYHTNPWSPDTDGDTLGDADEINIHGTNPLLKDGDGDGLDDATELNIHQTDPNLADSDGDGINDKSEIKQGTDANNAASRPAFESVEVIGDGDEGVRRTKQITITLPEGEKSYVVVIAASSEEYPDFTGGQSKFDDVVDWKITLAGGTVIEGEKHVNDLHDDWEQSETDGTSYLGLSPVAIVATEVIQGRAGQTTSVQIELGATNVSDSALPTTLAAAVLPVETILDNNNIAYNPDSEALGVSNYVTNNELPATSQFDDVNPDPENFRLQARLLNSTTNSVQMQLEVQRDGSIVTIHNYTLDKKDGVFVRGNYLRLVSDTSDDAESGDQTILVKLGDKIKVSYDIAAGTKVGQEIHVGRPSSEDNNDQIPRKHDIKELKVNIVVMKNSAGTGPVVPRTTVDGDIEATNERLAQSGIRLTVLNVNMGAGDNGVDFPAMQGANYSDGFDATIGPFTQILDIQVLQPLTSTSPDEDALFSLKYTDVNSIDIFYIDFSVATSEFFSPKAFQYRKWRNNTNDPKNQSTALLSSNRTVFTMCHEIMHILLNSGEHGTVTTSVRYSPTTGKEIDGTKRIGPYPGALIFGSDDTTTIRRSAETLP